MLKQQSYETSKLVIMRVRVKTVILPNFALYRYSMWGLPEHLLSGWG